MRDSKVPQSQPGETSRGGQTGTQAHAWRYVDMCVAQQIGSMCGSNAMRAAGCARIYKDKAVNATARNRPGLRHVRNALQPGDIFIVWAVDRAFRSVFEAIAFLDDLTKHGIVFRSLEENIDPRTLEGRRWYIDKANNAEYERGVIGRRTREAMAALKRRGRKFGHRPKLTKKQIAWARKALRGKDRKTKVEIAKRLRVCTRTLSRAPASRR
ncbi:MAG: recombinase family protein [Steroidobacteraceae bacterium]